jgi:hypothetical protein
VVKACLLTKDNSLKKELSSVMPTGFKVVKGLSGDGGSFILFGLDTSGETFIAEHSERTFVIAVTKHGKFFPEK